jgi:hypothetical protein
MFAAIGQWFLTSKIGHVLLAIGAVLFAVGIAALGGFEEGKYREAKANAKQRIDDAAKAAKAAQQTYADADTAAQKVKEQAKQQPAPDVVKRDDLDSTF